MCATGNFLDSPTMQSWDQRWSRTCIWAIPNMPNVVFCCSTWFSGILFEIKRQTGMIDQELKDFFHRPFERIFEQRYLHMEAVLSGRKATIGRKSRNLHVCKISGRNNNYSSWARLKRKLNEVGRLTMFDRLDWPVPIKMKRSLLFPVFSGKTHLRPFSKSHRFVFWNGSALGEVCSWQVHDPPFIFHDSHCVSMILEKWRMCVAEKNTALDSGLFRADEPLGQRRFCRRGQIFINDCSHVYSRIFLIHCSIWVCWLFLSLLLLREAKKRDEFPKNQREAICHNAK